MPGGGFGRSSERNQNDPLAFQDPMFGLLLQVPDLLPGSITATTALRAGAAGPGNVFAYTEGGVGGLVAGGSSAGGAAIAINPYALAIAGGMLLYGILSRPNGKDRRSKGFAFAFRDNPADPNDPLSLGYGKPTFIPTVLFRYLTSTALNQTQHYGATQGFKIGLSLGAGPIDGGDLQLWMDDQRLFKAIEADSPASDRTLRPALGDTTGKVWAFPDDNIAPGSVTIFVNGTLYASAKNGVVEEADKQSFTTKSVKPREFNDSGLTGLIDSDLSADRVVGGLLPVDGVARSEDLEIEVVLKGFGIRQPVSFDGGTTTASGRRLTIPTEAIHTGETDDDKRYFWIASYQDRLLQLFDNGYISSFNVAGKYARTIRIEPKNGQWVATFNESQAGATVTYTGSSSILGDDITFDFRPGTVDQEPLPTDAVKNAKVVGEELAQATASTYTSTIEVDDLELILESGPEGFTDPAVHGRNAGDFRDAARHVQMFVREDGAADQTVSGSDPSKGWVILETGWQPGPGKVGTTFKLIQNTRGTARWIFSVADLLHFKRTGERTTGNSLPKRAKYQVKVVATDAAGNRGGTGNDDGVVSDLFFAAVQEAIRVKLILPYHATLTVDIGDLERVPAEPVFAVASRTRKVWVPDSNAVYASVLGRPYPGSYKWSRNPIWCACDLITNPWFGGGEYYTWQHINLASAIAAAAFCDATETYGTRAELDTWVNSRAMLWDHVSQMCAGARVLPALDGGKWRFVIDQDGDAVMALTEDDFEDGTLRRIDASLEEIPTELEAAFTAEEQDFELDTELRRVSGEPAQRVSRRIDLTGVRRRAQAGRVLDLTLAQFLLNTHSLEAQGAGWRMLALESGDIVTITATTPGATGEKYRVESLGIGDDFRPRVRFARNDPNAYGAGFAGANSSVEPGLRPPSMGDTTKNGTPNTHENRQERGYVSSPAKSTLTVPKLKPKRVKGSGSAYYLIDIGSLPRGARAAVCRWGRKGAPKAPAGEHGSTPFQITVPNVGALELEVYLRDADGTRGPSRFADINTQTDKVVERVGIKDAEVTTAPILAKQEGGTLTITPTQPPGTEAQEVEYEVRVSEPEEAEDEALLVGTTKAGVPIQVNTWPVDNMRVHVRPRYADTGEAGDWAVEDVDQHTTPEGLVVVEDNAGTSFGSWTIATLYGYTPLEDSTGLQNVAVPPIWNTTNTNSIWGMTGSVPIWALRDYFPYGLITAPAATISGAHDFLPGMYPEFSANTKTSRPIWGMTGYPPLNPVRQDANATGDFREHQLERRRRWRDYCMWNATDWDRTPVEIKHEVSTNGGADWATVQPGRRYRSSQKQSRFHIYCRGGTKRVKLTRLRDIRWVWNKKWEYKVPLSGNITGNAFAYTFSPVPDIEGTPVASVSVVDESLAANTQYVATITSLTATAIAVTIHDINTSTPSFGVPTATDTYLNIVLTGY